MQTYNVCVALCAHLRLRVSCFAGGYDKTQQFKEMKSGIELCVGTPGRIIDLATMKGIVQLKTTLVAQGPLSFYRALQFTPSRYNAAHFG